MQRAGAVEAQIIGDVDERVDGPKPDRREPLLQPGRAWPVPDAAHEAQRESRGEMGVIARKFEARRHGAGEGAGDPRDGAALEPAEAGGGEVARDALDAHRIGPVRQKIDVDDRVGETGKGRESVADGRILRQLQNALAFFGEPYFRRRTQHAARIRRRG